jgi:E3 SUMO-protein ligase RanBP2
MTINQQVMVLNCFDFDLIIISFFVFAIQGSFLFGTSSVNITTRENNHEDDSYEPDIPLKLIVQLSVVEVKTGEEDENILFCEHAKLYRFEAETNQMIERGVGEIKILQHKTTKICRILMRREQILKLCANHQITSQMELKPHLSSQNAYIWSAMDFTDGEAKHETLCPRFKSDDVAKRFVLRFNEAKRGHANAHQ